VAKVSGSESANRALQITQRHGVAGVLRIGPRAYRLTRFYRPTWATVAGCLTAPTVLGLGLLLVRRVEQCTLSIGRVGGVDRVGLVGRLPEAALIALRAELAPTVERAPGGDEFASGRPSLRTVLRRVVEFDTGERAAVGVLMLVGRQPTARDGESAARLIPVKDPSRSVSKTHLAMGEDDRGVWVVDRNSTNGTTVVRTGGRARECPPGERVYLPPGVRVVFGERSFAVREARGVDASPRSH
jgi:hypothetical protein